MIYDPHIYMSVCLYIYIELDNALGDTQCEIQGIASTLCVPPSVPHLPPPPPLSIDHETAIMHRLQEVILEHSTALLTVVELVAELDW